MVFAFLTLTLESVFRVVGYCHFVMNMIVLKIYQRQFVINKEGALTAFVNAKLGPIIILASQSSAII